LKNRLLKIVFFFLLVILLCPEPIAYSVPADVTDISDNKYFEVVHSSLEKARDSIYVSLYGVIVSKHDKLSLPYLLLQDLINAHKREVRVVVRLDKSYDYRGSEGTEKLSRRNEVAYLILSEAGIDCKFVTPTKTLHDKLIVIDGEIVIEGSMNWSTRALKLNRESVSLIKSEEYAKEKIQRIETLEIAGEGDLDRAQVETVAIRNKFLRDPVLGAKLVHNRNERGFDTYLFYLKISMKPASQDLS
jgi:phosphatidylserine/phosphatidylglycerophosphate/cardiolipin synthase-like enzyme